MRLVCINGKIWELSILQSDMYVESKNDSTDLITKNRQAIKNLGWHRGIVRTLSNHGVKSKATAIIETEVSGLPHQMTYDVYHNSKGFFCKVQGERIFLNDLIDQ
ncbi:hypothetical protein K9N50_11365 [bacterium]|nr:hypothetical protein [bacterium]